VVLALALVMLAHTLVMLALTLVVLTLVVLAGCRFVMLIGRRRFVMLGRCSLVMVGGGRRFVMLNRRGLVIRGSRLMMIRWCRVVWGLGPHCPEPEEETNDDPMDAHVAGSITRPKSTFKTEPLTGRRRVMSRPRTLRSHATSSVGRHQVA
jgi:hypothetical protein